MIKFKTSDNKKTKVKTALMILMTLLLISFASINSIAVDNPSPYDQIGFFDSSAIDSGYSTNSVNTSFTLDFTQSTIWVLDFNNSAFLVNHSKVEVKYLSNSPANPTGTVKIELYQEDPDSPGTYEPISDSYTYWNVTPGSTIDMNLPNGTTLTNYRVVFTRIASSINSGVFSVRTH